MMHSSDKYEMDDPDFDVEHGVLKNKLAITDEQKLEHAENQALVQAYDTAALKYQETHTFSSDDVREIHRMFLGDIYTWAGKYRDIDISSPGIRWCHALFIEAQMAEFSDRLAKLTPFSPDMTRDELLARSAEIHGEFIMIHPFRDGNGRTCRLLGDLLLMQAEMRPMKLTDLNDVEIREEYFAAIRDVYAKVDYTRLIKVFDRLIPQS